MNYIQYLSENKKLKTLQITLGNDGVYKINTINEPFFICSVFINNIRVNGVSFENANNPDMLAVINDLTLFDVEFIDDAYYFNPHQEIKISVSDTNLSNSISVSNFPETQNVNIIGIPDISLNQKKVRVFIGMQLFLLSFTELSEMQRELIYSSFGFGHIFRFDSSTILAKSFIPQNSTATEGPFGSLFYGKSTTPIKVSFDNQTYFDVQANTLFFANYWKVPLDDFQNKITVMTGYILKYQ